MCVQGAGAPGAGEEREGGQTAEVDDEEEEEEEEAGHGGLINLWDDRWSRCVTLTHVDPQRIDRRWE
jgi:hypothetical protein